MSSSQLLFSFGSVRNKTSIVPDFPVNGVHLENECEIKM